MPPLRNDFHRSEAILSRKNDDREARGRWRSRLVTSVIGGGERDPIERFGSWLKDCATGVCAQGCETLSDT